MECPSELFLNRRDAFLAEEECLLFTDRFHFAGELSGDECRFRVTYTLSSNV
jgi:hypothetical protein